MTDILNSDLIAVQQGEKPWAAFQQWSQGAFVFFFLKNVAGYLLLYYLRMFLISTWKQISICLAVPRETELGTLPVISETLATILACQQFRPDEVNRHPVTKVAMSQVCCHVNGVDGCGGRLLHETCFRISQQVYNVQFKTLHPWILNL